MKYFFTTLLFTALAMISGCSTVDRLHPHDTHFTERSIRHDSDQIISEGSALSVRESEQVFGAKLNLIGIQPVWIKVTNNSDEKLWFFPMAVDHNYFPPFEVATRAYLIAQQSKHELYEKIQKSHFPRFIPPNSVASGFVFTNSDEGMKAFEIELHSPTDTHAHTVVAPVPGMPSDYYDLDTRLIYPPHEMTDLTLNELRQWISEVPCCSSNAADLAGDPANVVFIGSLKQVRDALISRQWDVTAPITRASLMRMVSAFIFGSRYRYAPISELYLLDRKHDLAFQKARAVIDERNHMRLWLAPVTYEGEPVWFGQISRDVGVKLSGRLWPPTTHVIDPDVDDARFYLLQDLIDGQSLAQLAYVRSQPESTPWDPHYNAENDPYFTDGLRAIFFIADEPVSPAKLEILNWELPPELSEYLHLGEYNK